MTKLYAKKREPIPAAQWTGTLTPELAELLGDQLIGANADQQLMFSSKKGPSRFAIKGQWIANVPGEGLYVIADDDFRKTFEEVDEAARPMPTEEQHEDAGVNFVRELDVLLLAGLKLSREDHQAIFTQRDRLVRTLRRLLEDHAYIVARNERHRIRDKFTKELTP